MSSTDVVFDFFRQLSEKTNRLPRKMMAPKLAIIDGKRFDPETADQVASFMVDGEKWLVERLHRTAAGRFFLVAEGSGWTSHGFSVNGACCDGGQIYPLDEGDAKRWLDIRGLYSEYEQLFGAAEEA